MPIRITRQCFVQRSIRSGWEATGALSGLSRLYEKEFTMLVLSRRPGESIVLPKCDATITILSVRGGQVRVGVHAPACVEIYRQEVYERIQSFQRDPECPAAPGMNPAAPIPPK
jgi:carbon storage regulator